MSESYAIFWVLGYLTFLFLIHVVLIRLVTGKWPFQFRK